MLKHLNKPLSFFGMGLMVLCLFSPSMARNKVSTSPSTTAHKAITGPVGIDNVKWSVLLYAGWTSTDILAHTVFGLKFHYAHERLYSAELTYTLDKNNPFRRFFDHIFSTMQLAANVTYRFGPIDAHPIYEFDPHIMWLWTHFPWNRYVYTNIGVGEGVSYASSVPAVEHIRAPVTRRFLNYLAFEIDLAPPSHPNIQFAIRIHHRSAAYGLYGAGTSGSNVVGVGLRYYFQ